MSQVNMHMVHIRPPEWHPNGIIYEIVSVKSHWFNKDSKQLRDICQRIYDVTLDLFKIQLQVKNCVKYY